MADSVNSKTTDPTYWDYFSDPSIPWYKRAVAGALLPIAAPLSLAGCGPTDGPSQTDSENTPDTSPPNKTTYDEIASEFEIDGDQFLSMQTPDEVLSQIVNGEVLDVPDDVYENVIDGLLDEADGDPTVYPGAPELCDNLDNDQDGEVDEDAVDAQTWYRDQDDDGAGDPEDTVKSCSQPAGYVDHDGDCDDDNPNVQTPPESYYADNDGDGYGAGDAVALCASTAPEGYSDTDGDADDEDATVHPSAEEICDEKDNDQDGNIDEDVTNTYYADNDRDGYGDPDATTEACSVPTGYVENADDMDDTDATLNPETEFYYDGDGDGYGDYETILTGQTSLPSSDWVLNAEDADDTDGTVYPGATEICDEKDNNQDGTVDEGVTNTFYADDDSDGYGNAAVSVAACSAPSGYVVDNTDCDDSDGTVHTNQSYYVDSDLDGVGGTTTVAVCASTAPSGYATTNTDCNDSDATVSSAQTFYTDGDGDGYGSTVASALCYATAPSGYSSNATDCDDAEALANPGASEIENDGIDNDCDPSTVYQLEGDYSLADADFQGSATSEDANDGWSIGAADVDGDGFDDLLVGAPQSAETTGGGVYVLYGSASGLTTSGYVYMRGVTAGDIAGYAVAGAGDVDNDGMEDVLVGAPYEGTNGSEAGVAYLVLGPDVATATLDSIAESIIYGIAANYHTGTDVASAGDVNNDGFADFLVGSTGYNSYGGANSYGAAHLIYGPISGDLDTSSSDTTIEGPGPTDNTGRALSGGNVNGDAYSDILMGSFGGNAAHIFYGPVATGTTTTASNDVEINGDPTYGSQLGYSGTLNGDTDGDGYHDIIVCDRLESSVYTENGACYLFYGDPALPATLTAGTDEDTRWLGPEEGAVLGASVAAANINGDGYDDVIIGVDAAYQDAASTAVYGAYVYYGPITAGDLSVEDADAFFQGENQDDLAGNAVGSGDFNGDGFGDVSVGAPWYDTSRTDAGRDYTFYGLGE